MDVETHTPTPTATSSGELVLALEQATLMAKRLQSTTTDPSHLLQIHTTLNSAHRQLSLYLADHPPPASAVDGLGYGIDGGDAMEMGDDDDDVEGEKQKSSKGAIANVVLEEERMRDCCFIRRVKKRPLSPSAVENNGGGDRVAAALELDPVGSKLRSLDLIFQFHA